MEKKFLLLLIVFLLPACALTGGAGEAPQDYVLRVEFDAPARAANENGPVLVVAEPEAASGFKTRKMIYLKQPSQLNAYAYNRWAAPPAQMLTPLLAAALESTGAFSAVIDAGANVYGRYRLNVALLKLQQEFFVNPSRVRLVLRANLIDVNQDEVLFARTLEVLEPAPGNDPESGVEAANRAVTEALRQLAVLVTNHIDAQ